MSIGMLIAECEGLGTYYRPAERRRTALRLIKESGRRWVVPSNPNDGEESKVGGGVGIDLTRGR